MSVRDGANRPGGWYAGVVGRRGPRKVVTVKTLALVALLGVSAVASIPRAIANACGAGYRSSYDVNGQRIERPKHFSSKAHKAAFENVGDYVSNALTRDVMLCFRDRDLSQDNFLRPKGVPLDVWHEVLEFFAEARLIELHWEMQLPPYDGEILSQWSFRTPDWLADGTRIDHRPKDHPIGGEVPGSAPFSPGLLTTEQKTALLGTQYALTYTDCLHMEGGTREDPAPQRYATLGEEHFKKIYVRNRSVLGDKEFEEGAKRLARVFAAAA